MVVTAPAKWMVSQGISQLTEKMQEPARAAFAADLANYVASPPPGSCLATPPCTDATAADWDALNKLPSVRALKARLTNDGVGTDIVDDTVVGMLTALHRDELTTLAQHAQSIEKVGDQVEKYHQALTDYEESNDNAVQALQDKLDEVKDTTDDELNDISLQESKNGVQLGAVEDLMYRNASAADKLALLQSGYGADRMSGTQIDALQADLKAQATREAIQDYAKSAVNVTQNLNVIATSLNLPPVVTKTLEDASAWEGIVGSAAGGNYLGALAGIFSFFGSHGPSPEQIMLNHIDQRFDRIEKQLDGVLQGEQAINQNIQLVSQQVDTFARNTEAHLYEIDSRLSDIQGMVQQQTYSAAAKCQFVEKKLNDDIRGDGLVPDLRDPDQLDYLNDVTNWDGQVNDCVEFLEFVDGQSMQVPKLDAGFVFRPLAYAFLARQGVLPASPLGNRDAAPKYETPASDYFNEVYSPAEEYFLSASGNALPAFGIEAGTKAYQSFEYAALPVRDVRSLKKKLAAMTPKDAACTASTSLSLPVFEALCPDVDAYSPPAKAAKPREDEANNNAVAYLRFPIYLDAIDDLSRWALFFSPLVDYQVDGKIQLDAMKFLGTPGVKANGRGLVDSALQLDTLGIAQANMIYGDVLASLVFNDLWSNTSGLSADAPAAPKDANRPTQKEQAQALFTKQLAGAKDPIAQNVYLQKNVLMIAMDQLWKYAPTNWDHAYEFALDYFAESETDPDYMLDVLFNRDDPNAQKIKFGVRWVLKDGADATIDCNSASADRAKACLKVPTAQILGQTVDLPSIGEFSSRSLFYPQMLMDMIGYRDQLAAASASYRAFDIAVRNEKDKAAKDRMKAQLAKSLTEAVR